MVLEPWRRSDLGLPANRAIHLVYAHHSDPALTLSRIAGAVRLSTFHLSRVLKRKTGMGFVDHLRAARVAHAERLLRTSTLSVKEVAGAVGYMNTNALDRNFVAVFTVTPTVYRRMAAYRARDDDAGQETVTSQDSW